MGCVKATERFEGPVTPPSWRCGDIRPWWKRDGVGVLASLEIEMLCSALVERRRRTCTDFLVL